MSWLEVTLPFHSIVFHPLASKVSNVSKYQKGIKSDLERQNQLVTGSITGFIRVRVSTSRSTKVPIVATIGSRGTTKNRCFINDFNTCIDRRQSQFLTIRNDRSCFPTMVMVATSTVYFCIGQAVHETVSKEKTKERERKHRQRGNASKRDARMLTGHNSCTGSFPWHGRLWSNAWWHIWHWDHWENWVPFQSEHRNGSCHRGHWQCC